MSEGLAEYREPDTEPYRILVLENAIKEMDTTFPGRPVYVKHVDSVDLKNLQAQADGYVVESFFNKNDGKHWAKFVIVSDKGHEAIRSGWKLSNAYVPKDFAGGGMWHGVDYAREVTRGEYDHLAIVPNPRYEESVILTPEQFKAYNETKELELARLANSNDKEMSVLNFFKKNKVENSSDMEGMSVMLPKSKKEKTIAQLVNDADDMAISAEKPQYANGDHKVKVGDTEEMTVNGLLDCYKSMKQELDEIKKKNSDSPVAEKDPEEEKKKNAEAEEEKKKNADAAAAAEEEKKTKNAHFEALKNANQTKSKDEHFELAEDKVARGKARYGSGN